MAAIFKIIHLLLVIFSERGKSAPARLEKKEDGKIKEALAENDFVTVSTLLRNKRKRVLRAKTRNPK